MLTAAQPAAAALVSAQPAAAVLTFAAEPGGAPPPVLRAGAAGDVAFRPAGGEPMLVLRHRADVLRALTDTSRFGMAGVTATGELSRCPLTGAEMQSPDGGLLNMDPPRLREYRQRISSLFTRRAAEATRPAVRSLAQELTASLAAHPVADALAGFAEPFAAAAVCGAMGIPLTGWEEILEFSRVAFAVVPSAAAAGQVAAAWEDLYRYYEPVVAAKRALPDGTLTSRMTAALDGFTTTQVTHVIATVSNGFGAVLPVLATALTEIVQRPQIITGALRGQRSWAAVAAHLLSYRTVFPVALPRRALADTWLGAGLICEGTVVVPSLIAAVQDSGSPPGNLAFGAGPHFCPGAGLTRVWLASALEAFFGAFPAARLVGSLDWQPGTLSVPREITLALR